MNAPYTIGRASFGLHIAARPSLRTTVDLLESVGLPVADLTDGHLEHFFYCGPSECLTGLVGLELYGTDALLRSLVVTSSARGNAIGSALVTHAEIYARMQGVRALYLLTTTAESFFSRRGYQRIARGEVISAIESSREFKELCPERSALMAKAL